MLNASLLRDRIGRATDFWKEARATSDENKLVHVGTLRGVLENSTAKMPDLENRRRKKKFEIAWPEACEDTAEMIADAVIYGFPCEFNGWEVGSNSQEIEIKRIFREAFAVQAEEDTLDNILDREELFNEGYVKAQNNIAKKMNAYFISKLIEFAGDQKFHKGIGAAGLTGPNSWKLTKIPYKNTLDSNFPQVWTNYSSMVGRVNKLLNPYVIEGGFLQVSQRINGELDKYTYGNKTVYSDLENMLDFGAGDGMFNDAFLIARGGLAFISTYFYPTTPVLEQGSNFNFYKFSRPFLGYKDANGKQIMMDITWQRLKVEIAQQEFPDLVVDNRCKIYDVYNLEVKGELFLNPLACGDNTTGIVHFKADEALDYIKTQNSVQYNQTL